LPPALPGVYTEAAERVYVLEGIVNWFNKRINEQKDDIKEVQEEYDTEFRRRKADKETEKFYRKMALEQEEVNTL
jgi:intein-encoded DNA endonuclease-like protein